MNFEERIISLLMGEVLFNQLPYSSWKDSDDASSPTDIDIYTPISLDDRDLEY